MDRRLPFGVIPKKSFGQNFLVDEKVVADLVNAAELSKTDVVVEIGSGTGVVTKELAKRAGKVLAFELDRDLISILEKNLQEFTNVEVLNRDFLSVGPQQFSHLTMQPFKLVGSIPYQITSPLIHKIIAFEPRPSLVVLLIQKEVAEKITASPPRATYLSNLVKLLGDLPAGRQAAEIVRFVPKTAFWPVPAVDGTIIKLIPSAQSLVPQAEIDKFQRFLHRGFQHPRKMLRTKFNAADLESCGIAPTHRAQTLDLDEWLKLYTVNLDGGTS